MASKQFAIIFLPLAALAIATPAYPATSANALCPNDSAQSIAQARAVLAQPQEMVMTDRDRAALLCLADAVEALRVRLDGLSAGTVSFDGQIHIPKGWVMTKPPTEEVR